MVKLKFIMSEMWLFLLPFIKVLLGQAGKLLMEAAMSAVTAAAAGNLSNEEKRSMAFRRITDDLSKQGLQLGASVVNAALEAAVLRIKN